MAGVCNFPCGDLKITEQNIDGKKEKVCGVCGKIVTPEAIRVAKELEKLGIN